MASKHRTNTLRGNPLLAGVLTFMGIVAAILVIVTVLDWAADDPAPPAEQFGVAPSEIQISPEEYRGETVIISGQITRVISPFAFVIGGEGSMNGGEILVVGPPPPVGDDPALEDELREADIVQVNGTVRDYDDIDFDAEFGDDVATEEMDQFQGEIVLVSEGTILSGRMLPETGDMVSTEDLATEPEEYVNERVTVDGEITEVLGDATFVLNDQLVVIDGTGTMTAEALEEAESADVSGEFVQRDDATNLDLNSESISEDALEGVEAEHVLVAVTILVLPETEADS